MNELLDSRYSEIVHRLALGIEPVDGHRQRRLSYQLMVKHDAEELGLPRPPIEYHTSNLFSLRYNADVKTPIDLRFFDLEERSYKSRYDRRRIVPRRMSIPILSKPQVEAAEQPEVPKDFKRRIRRPFFFPGAAYDFGSNATGLRGRVMRGGKPMRWARVVATLPAQTVVAGRAHGDDRGEFLLLLNANLTSGSALPNPFNIEVSVFGPDPAPTPATPDLPLKDELWDLPVELLANPGDVDEVADGKTLPANYTKQTTRIIQLKLGQCISAPPDFQIT